MLDAGLFRSRALSLLAAGMVLLHGNPTAIAQNSTTSQDSHPWTRFKPGAWKKVRVVTEDLDAQGNVTNTSRTSTTSFLLDVTPKDYHLQMDVSVEVAGKVLDAEPQLVSQKRSDKLDTQAPTVESVGTATYALGDRRIPCNIYQETDEAKHETTKVFYSESFLPHILKKETIAIDPQGQNTIHETTESVVAVDMPFKTSTKIVPTWHVRTVRKNPKGTTVTLSIRSLAVPGGVVANMSKELDLEGRVVRRSTLELVDFGLQSDRRFLRRRPLRRTPKGRRFRR